MVNIRLFETLQLDLCPSFNIFLGKNGVGKTSILEAVDLLSRGKSFRSSNISEIIKQNETSLAVSAHVDSYEDSTLLSLVKKSSSTELKVNSVKTSKWSELTQYLPIISIHPESYLVITGGPGERRKYIDWGLFHVEPSFRKSWSLYTRALKQRNICLRNKQITEAKQWHAVLCEYGLMIHLARVNYINAITPFIQMNAKKLNLEHSIEISYKQGWPEGEELADLLEQELLQNELPLSTSIGPHRANVSIKWNNKKFSAASSRGQQKALAIAMYLAQSSYMFDHFGKQGVYLVDELPAELDQSTCDEVLSLLADLSSQVIITSVSDYYLQDHAPDDSKWFHVEHGQASPVL